MLLTKIMIDNILIKKNFHALFIKTNKKSKLISIFLILKHLSLHRIKPYFVFVILKNNQKITIVKKIEISFFETCSFNDFLNLYSDLKLLKTRSTKLYDDDETVEIIGWKIEYDTDFLIEYINERFILNQITEYGINKFNKKFNEIK